MLSHNDLKKGTQFIFEGVPYEVQESSFTYKGRGSSTMNAKIKNLKNGNIVTKTFHAGENFAEAELKKVEVTFIYTHRDSHVFSYKDDPGKRFELSKEQLGNAIQFLKANEAIEAILFNEEIINISLPIKVQLKVTEAPPGIKGDRAQAGTKVVTLETGATVNAPLFVEIDDVIEINTESKEYVRRVS